MVDGRGVFNEKVSDSLVAEDCTPKPAGKTGNRTLDKGQLKSLKVDNSKGLTVHALELR